MTALILGTLLALVALAYVLWPLVIGVAPAAALEAEPVPAAPAREAAIEALREIEFDRATGKLSEGDYAALKASYTRHAIEAMRGGGAPVLVCPRCGPRPEVVAVFCSNCGGRLAEP